MALIERVLAQIETLALDRRRPVVTLSYAQSLDGSITACHGSPFALSSPAAAQLTHQLRAAHTAILVGIGTILADNPRLTVRHVPGNNPQPVVLDSQLRLPSDANLVRDSSGALRFPWVAHTERAPTHRAERLAATGVRLICLPASNDGRVPLPALLDQLYERGVTSLMVEGGASVITSFLSERLVDLILLTIAPLFVGGYHAVETRLDQTGSLTNRSFPRLQAWESEHLGEDLIVWGQPVWPGESPPETV